MDGLDGLISRSLEVRILISQSFVLWIWPEDSTRQLHLEFFYALDS